MATPFAVPINNASTSIAVAATAGTLPTTPYVINLANGAVFPALTGSQYYRVTICQVAFAYSPTATTSNYTIYKADTVSGNTIKLEALLEGTTDRVYQIGDIVEVRVTAGTLSDIHTAVNTLETAGGGGDLLATLTNSISSITTTASPSVYDTMYNCSGTSSNYTVTLPAPTAKKLIGFKMDHGLTKLVTLSASSGNIDGQSTRVMWANEVAILLGDGTNWTKITGKSVAMQCQMYQPSGSVSIPNAGAVFTAIPTVTVTSDNTSGLMPNTSSGLINIPRKAFYNILVQTALATTTSSGTNAACVLVNGTTAGSLSGPQTYLGSGLVIAPAACNFIYSGNANDTVQLATYMVGLNGGSALSTYSSGYSQTINGINVVEILAW